MIEYGRQKTVFGNFKDLISKCPSISEVLASRMHFILSNKQILLTEYIEHTVYNHCLRQVRAECTMIIQTINNTLDTLMLPSSFTDSKEAEIPRHKIFVAVSLGCPEKKPKMLKTIFFTPLILMIIHTEAPHKISASYVTPYYQT